MTKKIHFKASARHARRRVCALLALLWVGLSVWAVPAQHIRRQVRLADGSTAVATLYGNSHLHWLLTDRGQVLVPTADGSSYEPSAQTHADMVAQMGRAGEEHARRSPRRIGSQATAPLPATGNPKVPVVLVNFADTHFTVGSTDEEVRQYYELYCNGTRNGQRYNGHGSWGAIRDYFIDQSDSLFQPEFVIIGPVQLDYGYAHYGKNNASGQDSNYNLFRTHAVQKAVSQFDIDWLAQFDNRGKNQVDMVFFIFAGMGEANGGDANTIWPKETGSSATIGGIRFATNACCNELRATAMDDDGNVTETAADGIGIMCHELSHALGLPDFYDTQGQGFGMDVWSVMDYGEYCANGYCPVGYTAYERDFMGWRPLQTLTEKGSYVLKPVGADGIGYKVVNPQNPNEYYVLENRQRAGWDRALASYGRGLMVTHVDYQASAWNNNTVNTNQNHQRMTIIAANDRYVGSSASRDMNEWRITWAGNLYPYEQLDSLTDLSNPAAKVWTSNGLMGQPIYEITQADDEGCIRFSFLEKIMTGINALPAQAGSQPGTTFGSSPARPADIAPAYDLSGRRINAARHYKGLVIRNGKLVRERKSEK